MEKIKPLKSHLPQEHLPGAHKRPVPYLDLQGRGEIRYNIIIFIDYVCEKYNSSYV